MKALAELQERFQNHLIEDDSAVIDEICGPDDEYRKTRLAIYSNAYRLRLIAALAVDYPALKALLGDADFEAMAAAYLEACPSTFRNLRWFGKAMANFLRSDQRYRDKAVLAELAAFEWAQGLAFDSADAPQTRFEQIASVPPSDWPALCFNPHPSLHLLESHWNVIAIWHAHRDENPIPEPEFHDQASTIAVWRKEHKTYFRTLDSDEAWLWRAFAEGASFAEACAGFAPVSGKEDTDAAQRAAGLLRGWIDEGWIQDYIIDSSIQEGEDRQDQP